MILIITGSKTLEAIKDFSIYMKFFMKDHIKEERITHILNKGMQGVESYSEHWASLRKINYTRIHSDGNDEILRIGKLFSELYLEELVLLSMPRKISKDALSLTSDFQKEFPSNRYFIYRYEIKEWDTQIGKTIQKFR